MAILIILPLKSAICYLSWHTVYHHRFMAAPGSCLAAGTLRRWYSWPTTGFFDGGDPQEHHDSYHKWI